MGDWSVFQGYQTITAHQNIHRHYSKCGNDTDMDCIDYNFASQSNEGDYKIRMASVESGDIYST